MIGQFHPNTPEDVRFAGDLKFFRLQIAEQGIWGGKVTKLVDDETGCVDLCSSLVSFCVIVFYRSRFLNARL